MNIINTIKAMMEKSKREQDVPERRYHRL